MYDNAVKKMQEQSKHSKQESFIERLNDFFPTVDFDKLDESCNLVDNGYEKEILKQMHDILVEVYGTDYFDDSIYEFIEIPAVIQGRESGHIGLGIIALDLESSAEHWRT